MECLNASTRVRAVSGFRARSAVALFVTACCSSVFSPAYAAPLGVAERPVNRVLVREQPKKIVAPVPRPVPFPIPKPEPKPPETFFREIQFIRGDINGDGLVDISDTIRLLRYLYLNLNQSPSCLNAADTDMDNLLTTADAIFGLGYLFQTSAPPGAP